MAAPWRAKRYRMGINLNPFTWWTGASWGTAFGLRGKARMGEDSLGNVYYEGGRDTAGNPRRWVIYNGINDTSRIAPEWFSWLHHQVADVPERSLPARRWRSPPRPRRHAGGRALRRTGRTGPRASGVPTWSWWERDSPA